MRERHEKEEGSIKASRELASSHSPQMLFWLLLLLSVVLADSHHETVLTKIREKRAVFDVLPTFRPDRTMELKTKDKPAEGKGRKDRQVLKRTASFKEGRRKEERRMRRKEMRKIFRRMVFKQALKTKSQRQEKQCLKEDSKKMKKKVSSVKDLIFGAFTALELFLRIG